MLDDSPHVHTKKTRQWMKARGTISPAGGHEAHLAALAYMSDSYFIGTVARVHKLWRYAAVRKSNTKSSIDEDVLKKLLAMDDEDLKRIKFLDQHDLERIRKLKNGEDDSHKPKAEIGMMVSLDHTIYFHDPRNFRADEWMFVEMETPWSGDGRGLVFQRLFTRDGRLIATCVQEVSYLNGLIINTQSNQYRVSFAYDKIQTHRNPNYKHVLSPIFLDAFCCIVTIHRFPVPQSRDTCLLSENPHQLISRLDILPLSSSRIPLIPNLNL